MEALILSFPSTFPRHLMGNEGLCKISSLFLPTGTRPFPIRLYLFILSGWASSWLISFSVLAAGYVLPMASHLPLLLLFFLPLSFLSNNGLQPRTIFRAPLTILTAEPRDMTQNGAHTTRSTAQLRIQNNHKLTLISKHQSPPPASPDQSASSASASPTFLPHSPPATSSSSALPSSLLSRLVSLPVSSRL